MSTSSKLAWFVLILAIIGAFIFGRILLPELINMPSTGLLGG